VIGNPQPLVAGVTLSTAQFQPSETSPAVLAFRAGRVVRTENVASIEPVLRLDLELRNAKGDSYGLLARLRDVLPGRYAFGLTGRDPRGQLLGPGDYEVVLTAVPTVPGPATVAVVHFKIGRKGGS
jgi:hypothetical protein